MSHKYSTLPNKILLQGRLMLRCELTHQSAMEFIIWMSAVVLVAVHCCSAWKCSGANQ